MSTCHQQYFKYNEEHRELYAPIPRNAESAQFCIYMALWECSEDHSGTTPEVAFMFESNDIPEKVSALKKKWGKPDLQNFKNRIRNVVRAGYIIEEANETWRIATRAEYLEASAKYLAHQKEYRENKSSKARRQYSEDKAFFEMHREEAFIAGREYAKRELTNNRVTYFLAAISSALGTACVLLVWGYFF